MNGLTLVGGLVVLVVLVLWAVSEHLVANRATTRADLAEATVSVRDAEIARLRDELRTPPAVREWIDTPVPYIPTDFAAAYARHPSVRAGLRAVRG